MEEAERNWEGCISGKADSKCDLGIKKMCEEHLWEASRGHGGEFRISRN